MTAKGKVQSDITADGMNIDFCAAAWYNKQNMQLCIEYNGNLTEKSGEQT